MVDKGQIKMVEQSGNSDTSTTTDMIPQSDTAVNPHSMQETEDDAQGDFSLMEDDQYKADIGRAAVLLFHLQ